MSARFEVEEFRVDVGDRTIAWRGRGIDIDHPDVGRARGFDETAVTVILDVDGNIDLCFGDLGRSDDVASLDRVIAALSTVRDGLTALYAGTTPRSGACFAQGDYGRCDHDHGHDGPHKFPPPDRRLGTTHTPEELARIACTPWAGSPVA